MAAPTQSLTPEQSHAAFQILLNGPAGLPPAGVLPNFENPPQNLASVFRVTAALALSFAAVAVAIRIYTKRFLIRSMGYEDYTSIIALVGFVGFAVVSILGQKSGGGTHMWDIRLKAFFRILYWVNLSAITYAVTVTFVKLSILLQYLRIFAPSRKENLPLFAAIHACIWSLVVFYLVDTLFLIFICTPREKIWNPLMTTGHCFDENASHKASGVFNVLSDFAILILPMSTVWNLQMPMRRRLLVIGVFATGLFACVTSVLRTYYTWRVVESHDINWDLIPMALSTWAELSIGIIVGCLPTLPKFIQHIDTKYRLQFSGSGTGRATGAVALPPKANVLPSERRPFGKYGVGKSITDLWNDPDMPRSEHREDYLVLNGFDATPLQVEPLNGPIGCLGQEVVTVRDDVESAQDKN